MLLQLPPEVLLLVIAHLPVSCVHCFRLIAHASNELFQSNMATIYHNVAIYHGIAPANASIDEILGRRKLYFDWLKPRQEEGEGESIGWKEYVQRFFRLESSWMNGRAKRMLKYNTNRRMHRIQIDEAEGTVLATIGFGGIVSSCLKSRSPLWVNPMVGGWAHCEFDKGFLIWGRGVAKIDIWRREIDQIEDPLPACDPDEFQRGISGLIRRMEQEGGYRDDLPGIRGRFEPFVCLHTETATSASRFVYPHLVLATRDAQIAYIYDVPSAKLLRKIELNPDNTVGLEGDDRVNYVEQSQTHVFVCMERQIVTYKKSDGAVDLIFRARQPPTHMLSIDPQDPGFEEEDDEEEGYGSWETTKKLPLCSIEDRSLLFKHFAHSALRTFQAVHVSPCGRIWVAICDESFIYVVTGGLEGTGSALEITEIYLGVEELHYLAFDGYHIAVAGDRGICTLSLGRLHESDDDLHLIHERIQRSSLQVFRPAPDVIMGETTCLQITDDSVWHVAAVGASGLTAGLERIQFGERLGGDQDEDD